MTSKKRINQHFPRGNIPNVGELDLSDMALSYLQRVLPEFLSRNRPSDVYVDMGFTFGGGALHAFGEGYFFAELFGVICIGLVFGIFVSISFSFRELFIRVGEPLYWVVFVAPWIMIIRGGLISIFCNIQRDGITSDTLWRFVFYKSFSEKMFSLRYESNVSQSHI